MQEIVGHLGFAPRSCTWELTLRCNLNCGHCGSRAGTARPGEMSKDVALRVAGELAALGCQRITLSGGEPTLSPYWTDVAEEASRLGVRVNAITNGVHVSREFVRKAKSAGLRSLGVSLDGLEADHDRIRGLPGLYRNVQQLLEDCAAENMPVGVVTTVWKGNLHHLPEMFELLRGKVYVWQLQLGAAMGNLSNRVQQIVPEDLLELIPTIAQLIERNQVNINVADNIGYYGPYEKTLRTRRGHSTPCWIGCYAGCRHIGIQADGTVKGCLSMQATSVSEGNLHQESLRDIWTKPGAFAYNRIRGAAPLGGFCATCQYASVCRGGCHSMRICEGGSENPFCYHRVATLAAKKDRRRNFYVPAAIAPAALMAIFGIGCGGSTGEEELTDAAVEARDAFDDERPQPKYGLPDVYNSDVNEDVQADVKEDVEEEDVRSDVNEDDVEEDVMPADAYGIPDVEPETLYGFPDGFVPD